MFWDYTDLRTDSIGTGFQQVTFPACVARAKLVEHFRTVCQTHPQHSTPAPNSGRYVPRQSEKRAPERAPGHFRASVTAPPSLTTSASDDSGTFHWVTEGTILSLCPAYILVRYFVGLLTHTHRFIGKVHGHPVKTQIVCPRLETKVQWGKRESPRLGCTQEYVCVCVCVCVCVRMCGLYSASDLICLTVRN